MQEIEPLPQKCCAKCGFLYGLARRPANREDAIFDPDLLRSEDIESQYFPGRYLPGVITSIPYTKVVSFTDETEKIRVDNLTWADTHSICCYWKKYTHRIQAMGKRILDNEEFSYVPNGDHTVLATIRADRQTCDGFFEYFSGLSPKQHAEMRLDGMRAESARQHEEKLAKWSATQEERWQRVSLELDERQNKQETRRRESEARLTRFATWLTVVLLILTAIQAIAAVAQVLKGYALVP